MSLQELTQRFEALQRALQAADRQLGMMEQHLGEFRRAKQSLEGLEGGEQEVLLPIGGGVFVSAKVDPGKAVLSPVGAEYSVEGTREEAIERIGHRIAEAEAAFQELNARAQELGREYQEVAMRLQAEGAQGDAE